MPLDKDTCTTLANAIRALSMDAVQRANSGHPGAPMGMAEIATVLWKEHLKHNPQNPTWANRDRFVLSNGHASMLLYSLLHLTGYAVSMQDLKNFRQFGSKTPGHPEYGDTPGVETTTGPLGQGLANAVGMALAERLLAQEFNRPKHTIVDHHTYVFAGDGCLMEGISHEACSLAGTLGLGKLILFYDDNGISIDGKVDAWFTDDTAQRFKAYRWHVVGPVDGYDMQAIDTAIRQAKEHDKQPSLIVCKTTIGAGAPSKAGTAECHGAPLGEEEVAQTRTAINWNTPPFEVPTDIQTQWNACAAGAAHEKQWQQCFDAYAQEHPELAREFQRRQRSQLSPDWEKQASKHILAASMQNADISTRKASGQTLEVYTKCLPELVGGSADLAGSNVTLTKLSRPIGATQAGNYIYFGVREFAMVAISTGMALHRGLIPYTATFLTFSDYARNAVRMAALMGQRVVMIYTHDSIALGEDGPTHQPVEHLCSLRLIPNLNVWRPCDATETAVAWKCAIEHEQGPSALALTRQTIPALQHTPEQIAEIARGGYVLADCEGEPELLLIATGSEVMLARQVYDTLTAAGRRIRVVSMPCCEVFNAQPLDYRLAVLPPTVSRRIAVEAGASNCWYRYVGEQGTILGIDHYGASAPGSQLMEHFGFNAEHLQGMAESVLAESF